MEHMITLTEVERINRIILELHETSRPFHTRITEFFQSVVDLVHFDKASLLFFYLDGEGQYHKRNSITLNWDAALLEAYDRALYRLDDTLEPVDRPYHVLLRSSSFFHEHQRQKTPFWTEYQLPSNADYEIFGNVLTGGIDGLRCKLCLARSKESRDFTIQELRLIRLFQPHLSQITGQYLEEQKSFQRGDLIENYNCIGYCVLDSDLQIKKCSRKFHDLNEQAQNSLLCKLVYLCKSFSEASEPQIASFEYKLNEGPLFLEVVRSGENDGVLPQFNCIVYDLSHFFSSTLQQMKDQYHLSEREYEVFCWILRGLSNEDIANKLYLSVPSIKKYVTSILNKMEVNTQKQLFSKLKIF